MAPFVVIKYLNYRTYRIYRHTALINLTVLLYIWSFYKMFSLSTKQTDDSIKVKTTWLLPKSLVKQLKQYALDNDSTVTSIIIEASYEFLAKKKK